MMRPRLPLRKQRGPAFNQLWRIVDGSVRDMMAAHPDYFSARGSRMARAAIVKRVTNSIRGYVEQSTRGRSSASGAAKGAVGAVESSAADDAEHLAPRVSEAACAPARMRPHL